MSEWKPIETAPKDGRAILLTAFEDDGTQFETWQMMWGHIKRNGFFPDKVGMWMSPDGSFTWNGTPDKGGPTHWMPLPAPPKETGHE